MYSDCNPDKNLYDSVKNDLFREFEQLFKSHDYSLNDNFNETIWFLMQSEPVVRTRMSSPRLDRSKTTKNDNKKSISIWYLIKDLNEKLYTSPKNGEFPIISLNERLYNSPKKGEHLNIYLNEKLYSSPKKGESPSISVNVKKFIIKLTEYLVEIVSSIKNSETALKKYDGASKLLKIEKFIKSYNEKTLYINENLSYIEFHFNEKNKNLVAQFEVFEYSLGTEFKLISKLYKSDNLDVNNFEKINLKVINNIEDTKKLYIPFTGVNISHFILKANRIDDKLNIVYYESSEISFLNIIIDSVNELLQKESPFNKRLKIQVKNIINDSDVIDVNFNLEIFLDSYTSLSLAKRIRDYFNSLSENKLNNDQISIFLNKYFPTIKENVQIILSTIHDNKSRGNCCNQCIFF